MKQALRSLIVADKPDDAHLIVEELDQAGFEVNFERVDDKKDLDKALELSQWDIVLIDYTTPHISSTEVLKSVKKAGEHIPCVIVSDSIGAEEVVDAIRNGASDYVRKDKISKLGEVVKREIVESRKRRERLEKEEAVAYMAHYDSLTGLPNRILFKERLNQSMAAARRNQRKVAIMFVDLDRFKHVNDSLGHSAGDQLLKEIATRIVGAVREEDTVCRYGGDEFVLVFSNTDTVEHACRIAEKLQILIRKPLRLKRHEAYTSGSIGISIYPDDGTTIDELLNNADKAMYRVKEQGGDDYQLFDQCMNDQASEMLALESMLRHAVEKNEFVLHYQPVYEAASRQITGFEALLRWNNPQKGILYPSDFLHLAEDTGLIIPIGEWVIKTACSHNREWKRQGFGPIRISVNISARQFQNKSFLNSLQRSLTETNTDPRYLEIEIDESCVMQSSSLLNSVFLDIKEMGIGTVIDNFGMGYSSLRVLNQFPFDKLKIDRKFVHSIAQGGDGAVIACALVGLGKNLDREVIAEGVESDHQLRMLQKWGVDEVQGDLFCRPVPAEQVGELLKC